MCVYQRGSHLTAQPPDSARQRIDPSQAPWRRTAAADAPTQSPLPRDVNTVTDHMSIESIESIVNRLL